MFDYLPANTLFVVIDGALDALEQSWQLIGERYEQLRGDIRRPILDPSQRSGVELSRALRRAADADADTACFGQHANAGVTHPLAGGVAATDDRIDRWLRASLDDRTLLATSSPGHREMLLELLRGRGYDAHIYSGWQEFLAGDAALGITVAEIHDGFRFAQRSLRVITATDLGMERPRQRQRKRRARDPEAVIRELTDLQVARRRARGLWRRTLPRPRRSTSKVCRRSSCCSSTPAATSSTCQC
jgi:transcription-repair coupling factor (superfamily II helicase)